MDVFGSGGGENVAATLSTRLGYPVPLLGQMPLDPTLRDERDEGVPLTAGDTELGGGGGAHRDRRGTRRPRARARRPSARD